MSLWRQFKNLVIKTDKNEAEISHLAARVAEQEAALAALKAEADLTGLGEGN